MNTGNEPPVPAEPQPAGPEPAGRDHRTRAHDGNGRFIRTPETAARDARAAQLRAEGHTLQQIADELGYSSRSAARTAARRALREIVQGPAQQLLALHMERLESLYEAALDIMEQDYLTVSHGKVVKDDDGNPLLDPGPKLAALREARATSESFRKLVGLDSEKKINVSGNVRYEVVGVDPADLT